MKEKHPQNRIKDLLKLERAKPYPDRFGNIWWKLDDGTKHRDYGPAIEDSNGSRTWIKNELIHREDGPAMMLFNGINRYFIEGRELTEEEFLQKRVIKGTIPQTEPFKTVTKTNKRNKKCLKDYSKGEQLNISDA